MAKNTLTYLERSHLCKNPVAKRLLALMETKQTNLCFNPDVVKQKDFLALTDLVGPHICLLKTHIDILEDFDPAFIDKLNHLAQKHNFLIFEDRKFADIGTIVSYQYERGIYKIASWADITNAHTVPGIGIIEGLKKVGLPKGRALLLLAEMSSKGNLTTEEYTEKTIAMAKQHPDFVIGFIAMRQLCDDPSLIYLTPGVQKEIGSDPLGQQYKTPSSVIKDARSDIIIVGRGIYEAKDPKQEASDMQTLGWNAYLERLESISSHACSHHCS